jgi:hypothetical protein
MQIWNQARSLDWQAIDLLAEIHGASEPEVLVAELFAVRAFVER